MLSCYDPTKHTFTDYDGIVYPFFHSLTDHIFPEEAHTLVRFKDGSLTLQEAYSILLNLARTPKSKFSHTEFVGDMCITLGADTLEDLTRLQDRGTN